MTCRISNTAARPASVHRLNRADWSYAAARLSARYRMAPSRCRTNLAGPAKPSNREAGIVAHRRRSSGGRRPPRNRGTPRPAGRRPCRRCGNRCPPAARSPLQRDTQPPGIARQAQFSRRRGAGGDAHRLCACRQGERRNNCPLAAWHPAGVRPPSGADRVRPSATAGYAVPVHVPASAAISHRRLARRSGPPHRAASAA